MNKRILTAVLISSSLLGSIFTFDNNNVQAQTLAADSGIVTTIKMAPLYNENGQIIRNRLLPANTPWITGNYLQIPNIGKFYQVSTHEFVKAEDVSFQHGKDNEGVVDRKSVV